MKRRPLVLVGVCSVFLFGCCGNIEEDARALKTKHQKCSAGDTCVFVTVGGNTCLSPFGCTASINEKGSEEYRKEARELEKDYDHCNTCAQASCAGTAGLEPICNANTGKCGSREKEE